LAGQTFQPLAFAQSIGVTQGLNNPAATGVTSSAISGAGGMLGANNLSDVASTAAAWAALGGGTAGQQALPTAGVPGSFSSLVSATAALPQISATLTCLNPSGNYPNTHWYSGATPGTGSTITLTLPSSAGCADNEIVSIDAVQGGTGGSADSITYSGSYEGAPCPTLGTTAGNKDTWQFKNSTTRGKWTEYCGNTVPNTPSSVAAGGTGLATLTNHAVQVGAGTSAITQVGPDATSGQPLLSAGSSADPAYGALDFSNSNAYTHLASAGIVNTLAQYVGNPYLSQAATQNTTYQLINTGNSGYSVPGGTLSTTHSIDLWVYGGYLNASTSDTPTIAVTYGGTNICSGALSSVGGNASSRPWWLHAHLASAAATGTQNGMCHLVIVNPVASDGSAWVGLNQQLAGFNASISVDSTTAQLLAMTYDDTSSGNSTIKVYSSIITQQ
jgi:hypothetical protein